MPQTVYVIWATLLVVVVLALPLIVRALHRTYVAARSIERYFAEMLTAGLGIAGNTANIVALEDTIQVGVKMVETGGEIHKHAEIIKNTLAERAGASK